MTQLEIEDPRTEQVSKKRAGMSKWHTREGGIFDNFLSYYNRPVRAKLNQDVMLKVGCLLRQGPTLNVGCGWDWNGNVRVDVCQGSTSKNLVADARRLPFTDCSFDNVLGLSFLHHIKDFGTAVREMVRVARPSGRILLFEPGLFHPHSIHFTHILGMTKERPLYVNQVKNALMEECTIVLDDSFFGLRFAHFFLRHYERLRDLGENVPKSLQGYFLLVAEKTGQPMSHET